MSNLGLNILLGGYYGSALIGRHYAGSCQSAAQTDKIAAQKAENAEEAWPPSEEAVSEPKSVSQSIEERFEARLENRFRKPGADLSQAAAKAERLKETALDIGESLGQAKANEFMNKILAAVNQDGGALETEEAADLAAGSFFETLSEAAVDDPALYQKLEEVKRSFGEAASDDPASYDDPAEAESQVAAKAPTLTEAQGRLYQSYVQARSLAPAKGALQIAQGLGNLV
ncbi:MAG: hypothetical protein LBE49_06900, partial [Deltaproteobacteria bacterium]|nr:hypothetical protein [Deltaproteobacteria bacterium]